MMTLPMVSRGAGAAAVQEVIGLADAEIVEEDLVELVVVVLAGVDQDMIAVLVERAPSRATAG